MKDYLKDLLHFSKGVRWFVLTESMLGIGIGLFNLLLNLHLLELGLNEERIGAIASFGVIVMGVVSIPCGLLAARYGRKKLLVLGLVFMAAGYIAFGAGNGLWMMYGAQLLQSAGISFLITTEVQLLYSYSKSKKEETQGFSMLFAVFTLFMGVGTLAGGFLPRLLGGWNTSYQWTMVVAGGFIFLGAAARWVLLPKEAPRNQETAAEGKGALDAIRLRMPSRAVWIFCGINVMVNVAATFVDPFLNVIVKFRLDWTDEATSLLLTLHGFALFISSFLMPPLLERLGTVKTYRLVFTINLVWSLSLAAAMPVGLFSIVLLARGGAFIMLNNLVLTHSMSALPEQDRDAFAGLRLVLRSIAASGATYGAGVLLAGKHYGIPFLLAGVFLAAAFLFFEKWVKPLLGAEAAEAARSQD
jgi:MFS transporter, DHA1 family, multidrug resistance protein